MSQFKFICRDCGPSDEPCHHYLEQAELRELRNLASWVQVELKGIIAALRETTSDIVWARLNAMHQEKPITELEEIERIDQKIEKTDEGIKADLDKLVGALVPRLSFIKIKFGGAMPEGPVTIPIGQTSVATIDGFDQNGAPFTGTIPTPSYSIDNTAIATAAVDATNPAAEDVTAVSAGTANLTASLTSAEGKALTDTETVTVPAAAPVLSSIKINFGAPGAPAPAAAKTQVVR